MTVGLDWLPAIAFTYIVLFARIGAMLMLMPALGEQTIPARMRLSFALAFALVLFPLVGGAVPAMPADLSGMAGLLLHELAIGLMIVLMRDVPDKSAAMHLGQWNKSATGSKELRGKTLGIVGYGAIGSQLSVLAEALGMRLQPASQ